MFKRMELLQQEAESTTSTGASAAEAEKPVVTETPAPADNAGVDAPVDWAAVAEDNDEGEESVVASPATEAPKTEETPAPTTTAAPAATTAAAPVTAETVTPAPKLASETLPTKTAEQLAAERTAAEERAKAEDEKAFTGLMDYYKLPEDLQIKLSTEPENVLPFLAAKIHQTIARSLAKTIQETLPQTVLSVQSHQVRETQAKENFFSRWPALKGKEDAVLRVGAMFRQLNPSATVEEAVERIGKATCETLGIPVTGGTPTGGGASTTVAATKTPIFTPAGGGGGGRGAAAPADNLFTNLADELLLEDQG